MFLRLPVLPATAVTIISVIAAAATGIAREELFPVTLDLESKDARIRLGITATIKIPLAKVTQVAALPISTVFVNDEDDQRYVYIKTGEEKFERKDIKAGINDHQFVEITEGLKKGDVVAKERPKGAAEGKKVKQGYIE